MLRTSLTAMVAVAALLLPTFPPAPANANSVAPADLDDFSSNPNYARYYNQKLTWSKDVPGCWQLQASPIECALVTVPRDWRDPAKGDLQIGIARIPGDELRGRRLLLSNPGGPGVVGHTQAVSLTLALGLDGHMGVGVDPRGVGMSTKVECPEFVPAPGGVEADGDSRDFTEAQVRASEKRQGEYFAACAAKDKTLLPYMGTMHVARDFNLVRALFEAPKADFFGASYGTWLGATLSRAFPSRFDRVVLDSNVEFSTTYMDSTYRGQTQGFSIGFDKAFLPFVARHDSTYHLGKTTAEVGARVERIRARIAADRTHLTPDQFDTSIWAKLYRTGRFDRLAKFLVAAGVAMGDKDLAGQMSVEDAVAMVKAQKYDSAKDDLPYGASVICSDTPNPTRYFESYQSLFRALPLSGYPVYDFCAGWPYPPTMDQAFLDRPVSPALMLQNEVDPATPYNGAYNAHRSNAGTRMVFVSNSYGHGLFSLPAVQGPLLDYLKKGQLPASDVRLLGTAIVSNGVADAAVYEMLHSTSPEKPLPPRFFYPQRQLTDLTVDQEATSALPKPDHKSVAATLTSQQQAMLDELADRVR